MTSKLPELLKKLRKAIETAAPLSTKKRNTLPDKSFAFPAQRKMPINDASHVRSAMSRFGQVKGVSDAEKRTAYRKIIRAARRFGIDPSGFQERWGKKYG